MLKIRVISSVIGLLLLISVVLLGKFALGAAVFLIALIGINEFYHSLEQGGYKPIKSVGYISCISILLLGFYQKSNLSDYFFQLSNPALHIAFAIFVLLMAMFMFAIFAHDKYSLNDMAMTIFGVLYVTFLFSFVILTRNMQYGNYFIWLIFIGAWSTDTFAYFAGISIGKTRFLPTISKKKTLEGSIGGLIGCIASTAVYGIFISKHIENLPLIHFIIIGVLCGSISQLGDWAASSVKRYVGVKDFGNLIPGHGGVLDRFDSILFIAPVIYFYVSFIIG